jgi:hypothetical protein
MVKIERAWETNKRPRPGDNCSISEEFSIAANARSEYSVFNCVWTRFATSSFDKPSSACSSKNQIKCFFYKRKESFTFILIN